MDPTKVGAAIKKLRIEMGMTQHSLADCLNVTDKAVSKWERGLSVPDISIVTKLSLLLNCDVDNLLEGNIAYLDKTWQGFLILKEYNDIFSGTELYGKPLVYLYLCYFMLAGIGNICIACPDRDRKYIEEKFGDGSQYGIRLTFTDVKKKAPFVSGNTMVVYNNPFVYGPNLTKYFQRAMSRTSGVSVLTVDKTVSDEEILVSYDNNKAIKYCESGKTVYIKQYCTPILFVPKRYFKHIVHIEHVSNIEPLFAEPMGNGMIEYSITNEDSLWDTVCFLRYLKKRMGKDVYDIDEIARNRNFME